MLSVFMAGNVNEVEDYIARIDFCGDGEFFCAAETDSEGGVSGSELQPAILGGKPPGMWQHDEKHIS